MLVYIKNWSGEVIKFDNVYDRGVLKSFDAGRRVTEMRLFIEKFTHFNSIGEKMKFRKLYPLTLLFLLSSSPITHVKTQKTGRFGNTTTYFIGHKMGIGHKNTN
jgi:hypothetical protein